MYTQTNTNQPEYTANDPYIPAPMPRYHTQAGEYEFEPEAFNTPSCMRTLMERYIGKIIRAQFLIGDSLHDHVGRLMSVGSTYIVIEALKERVITICDLFSLKFVTVMFEVNNADSDM